MFFLKSTFTFISLFFLALICKGNDTFDLKQPISVYKLGKKQTSSEFLINHKNIVIPFEGTQRGFLDYVDMRGVPWNLTVKSSVIGLSQVNENSLSKNISTGRYRQRLVFDSSYIDAVFTEPKGELVFINSRISSLNVNSSNEARVQLTGNQELKFLVFSNNKELRLDIQGTENVDSLDFRSYGNTYQGFNLYVNNNETGNRRYAFQNDTVRGLYFSSHQFEDSTQKYIWSGAFKHELFFRDCYIDADFVSMERVKNARIVFIGCEFGPNAFLGDLVVDRVEFRNCRRIDRQINIGFRYKDQPAQIRIINTPVENLSIDWSDQLLLYFDSTDANDMRHYTYTNLLEKYKREGKEDSYRHIELQALKYKQSGFYYFISSIWWGHGYARGRVFLWAFLSVLIFTFINYKCWDQIQDTYSLFNKSYPQSHFFNMDKLLTALLYSGFVFFALTIRLDHLRLKKWNYVSLFLFQYSLGLFVVLFILKAIFEF
jgi:hypothetical protein